MRRLGPTTALLLCLAGWLLPARSLAQEVHSSISGVVLEVTGDPAPEITVVLSGPSGERRAQTTAAGAFEFERALPGSYELILYREEVEIGRLEEVLLQLERPTLLRIGLLASIEAEVEVIARALSVRAGSDYSESLDARKIASMPHGRDVVATLSLTTGARLEEEAGGVQIGGASGAEHRWFVDGLDVTSPQKGTPAREVPAEHAEEIQVKQTGFRAEFGGGTGGVVSVITRSGDSAWQGGLGVRGETSELRGDERPELGLSESGREATYSDYRADRSTRIDPQLHLSGPLGRRGRLFAGYEGGTRTDRRQVAFLNGSSDDFAIDRRWRFLTTSATLASDRLLARVALHSSPSSLRGGLPDRSGRGSSDPGDYHGDEERDNESIALSVDTLPTGRWQLTARAGRHRTDFQTGGSSSSPYAKSFHVHSNSIFPEVPASLVRPVGFSTSPSFTLWRRDEYLRTAGAVEVVRDLRVTGVHTVKTGIQAERIENSVLRDQSATTMEFQWGSGDAVLGDAGRGPFGSLAVYRYQTGGDVRSDNLAIFLQDTWSPIDSLTIDVGVRAEREEVPDFRFGHEGENAIRFDFQDKLAPRLGLVWSPSGPDRWTLFGSWGRFFDVTKYELPRVSFGSERRIRYVYALDGFDWPHISCDVEINDPSAPPDCGPEARFVSAINLRNASNDAIDPDLRPGESRQWQLGAEWGAAETSRWSLRYLNHELLRVIEDIGAFVPGVGEVYVIGNPGEGRSATAVGTTPLPRARRDFEALELSWGRRTARSNLEASYTWSRLEGNFPGLASSDESGRASPNVLRAYDAWFTPFAQDGRPSEGPLGTDRPHRLLLTGRLEIAAGTSLGILQSVASGTPRTTRASRNHVPFFPWGRGDLGRNPTLSQTDVRLSHRFGFRTAQLELAATVLNLLDEDTVLEVNEELHAGSLSIPDEEFLAGFEVEEVMRRQGLSRRPTYGKPSTFQAPRSVLMSVQLRF